MFIVRDLVSLMSAMPEDHRYSKYADYLFENYVNDHLKFPLETWAEITEQGETYSNIICGGYIDCMAKGRVHYLENLLICIIYKSALLPYGSPLFSKKYPLFRIMDPLKHKSPVSSA